MTVRPEFRGICLVLLAILVLPPPASGQLTSLETRQLRLLYHDATQGFIAPYVARCFENSLRFHSRLFEYDQKEKVTLVLMDFSDLGNAAAGAVPRNLLSVNLAPISFAFETYPANDRIYTLMNHELVHVVTLDQAAANDRFWRGLFQGKVRETDDHPESILYTYLTNPRTASPRWYREGVAVFIETWMAGGYGRAQGAYDEMVFRSMVRDSSRFYDPIGLESEGSRADFQGGVNSYLYGTRFMSYLGYRYSPEAVIAWTARPEGSRGNFAGQFRKVFGTSIPDAWQDWIEWERGFQRTNLDSIALYPTTRYRDLTAQALGSVSRAYVDTAAGELYAAVNYPGEIGHLAAISLADGSIRKICDIKNPAYFVVSSVAFDPYRRKLFYTADNYAWRDLCEADPRTGRSKTLFEDLRVGELVFNRVDSCLYGIRTFNALCTLVRIPPPYREWQQVHTWPYGQIIYDMDVSPDGHTLSASVAEISGRQTLRLFDLRRLAERDTTTTATLHFGTSLPSNFTFSADGTHLYGSSYYTGVSNIFRYDIPNDSLDVLTNAETGFFRPLSLGGDSLLVLRYSGKGFVPSIIRGEPKVDLAATVFLGQKLTERHPVVTEWTAGSPSGIPLDSLIVRKGEYRPLAGVELESAYPVVEGYKDFPAYGLRVNISDPIFLNQLGLSASYTPNESLPADERVHLAFEYHRHDWKLDAKLNDADFYDLFGPAKTSLKGYSLGLGYTRKLIFDEPRTLELNAGVTGYGGLERVPDAQNVGTQFEELLSGDVSLTYSNLKYSLGSLEARKGREWELAANINYVNNKGYPSTYATIAFGFPVPIPHSSLWLRSTAGIAPGERTEPFANFFLGGFGNNWVDHGSIKRYRDPNRFPGLEIDEAFGTNFVKALLEWNLPPLRFRHVGVPQFYLTWARTTLFSTGLVTNLDDPEDTDPDDGIPVGRGEYANAGAQLDLRFTMLSHLNMTLSLGYAAAVRNAARRGDEFMFSLKIL